MRVYKTMTKVVKAHRDAYSGDWKLLGRDETGWGDEHIECKHEAVDSGFKRSECKHCHCAMEFKDWKWEAI